MLKAEGDAVRSIERNILLPPGFGTVAEDLDHPEGICWCPKFGVLYAGGEHGQIYRLDPRTGAKDCLVQIGNGFILGLAVDGDGNIYACDIGNCCIHQVKPDGRVSRYGGHIAYPNAMVFGEDGTLFVTDSGSWTPAGDGSILAIKPGGTAQRLATAPLSFPNGLAMRGGWLFVVESAVPRISRVPVGGGEAVHVIDLPLTIPDGIAFDEDGGLWISCWQPNRIYRLAPDGELRIMVDDWSGIHVFTPNNLCFFGAALDHAALSCLGGNFIRRFGAGVSGAALHYPRISR